jgi:pilus assembly protein CpaE
VADLTAAVMLAYESAIAERLRAGIALGVADEHGDEEGARVVTVFSTKGGVGKSVVATNLSVALAELGHRTILLDLDLQFGDTGIMLQLRPSRTIFDAMLSFDRLDADMMRGFLTEHSSGLQVLLAPVHPEDAEGVTASRVARIISLLEGLADVIVIDTPGAFTDVVLAALDKSDDVYAVATMDVASIKNTKISLQKLLQLGYDDGRIKLVLNRADSKVWIEPGEVESAVDGEIVAKIPSDRLVPRSVNKGVPVVLDSPKSPVAKSLMDLARSIPVRDGEAD